jgi:hypothetical protein
MISMVIPIPAGNALRLFVQPPAGAVQWRILRKSAVSTFTGATDPDAFIAYEGRDTVLVDTASLVNGVRVNYEIYYTVDGVTWSDGGGAYGTPDATYEEQTSDVLTLLRARLEAGLQVELLRGVVRNDLGYIPVLLAPPSTDGQTQLPLVTLTLESERPSDRSIGECIGGDEFDSIGNDWADGDGWMAEVRVQVIVWSLNPDERNDMRMAIRRVILANLTVFSDQGLVLPSLEASHVDDPESFGAPIYEVVGTFTCTAPVRVGKRVDAIADVSVGVTDA